MEIIKPKSPYTAIGEGIDELMAKDGHLTYLRESAKLTEKYNNIKNNVDQFIEFKEDSKGIKMPIVNITGSADFIDKDMLSRHNGKTLTEFHTDIYNELKNESLKSTINPYAHAKINKGFSDSLLTERESLISKQSKLKNNYNINEYNSFLEKSVNNTTLSSYKNDILNATKALNLSSIDPNTKITLNSKIPKLFSSYLAEKLSYESPLDFIKLHQENPEHDVFTNLAPHEKHRYLMHATSYVRTENDLKLSLMDTELPNVLKSLEQYRHIKDPNFITEYVKTSNSLGDNTRSIQKIDKLKNSIFEAQAYYDFYHGGQSLDIFELKARYHNEFDSIKSDDPHLAVKLKLKDRIGSELKNLENLKTNDPAKYSDELRNMGLTNSYVLDNMSIHQKRSLLGSPKILTNNESANVVNSLNSVNTKDDLTNFNEALSTQFGANQKQILSEVSESDKVDPIMRFILKSYINENNHNVESLFNLRDKSKSGLLDDKMFEPKDLQEIKSSIYQRDNKELQALTNLPDEKARAILDLIYLSSKNNYLNTKDATKSVNLAIKDVLLDNYYFAESSFFLGTKTDLLVPKQLYNIKGSVPLEQKDADILAKHLGDIKYDKNYWDDLRVSSLTGIDLFNLNEDQKDHYMDILHESVGSGQFVLDESRGGYTFKFEMNGRIFYDKDGDNKKLFEIKDILSEQHKKQEKKLSDIKSLDSQMQDMSDFSKAIDLMAF